MVSRKAQVNEFLNKRYELRKAQTVNVETVLIIYLALSKSNLMKFILILLLIPFSIFAQEPVVDTEIGRKAFSELVGDYQGRSEIDIQSIISQYQSNDSKERKYAGYSDQGPVFS